MVSGHPPSSKVAGAARIVEAAEEEIAGAASQAIAGAETVSDRPEAFSAFDSVKNLPAARRMGDGVVVRCDAINP